VVRDIEFLIPLQVSILSEVRSFSLFIKPRWTNNAQAEASKPALRVDGRPTWKERAEPLGQEDAKRRRRLEE
jgi:hypothetical protein